MNKPTSSHRCPRSHAVPLLRFCLLAALAWATGAQAAQVIFFDAPNGDYRIQKITGLTITGAPVGTLWDLTYHHGVAFDSVPGPHLALVPGGTLDPIQVGHAVVAAVGALNLNASAGILFTIRGNLPIQINSGNIGVNGFNKGSSNPLSVGQACCYNPSDTATLPADQAWVTIAAAPPPNAAPVAGPDALNRPNTTPVAKVLQSALLANDTDADFDPLSVTAVGNPQPAGSTVVIAGGFVVYTAPASNAGNGSFEYTLSDGPGGHTVTGTVTVTETTTTGNVNGAPNALNITPSGADFVVTFLGVPGGSYRVQYTTDTDAPFSWSEFVPPAVHTAADNGVFSHTDVNPGSPVRLYRGIANP